jgi:hypothetical protein
MLEGHITVDCGEQRVVSSNSHVQSRLDARTALSHDDVPGAYLLTAVLLDTEVFGVALSPVA